MALPPDLPPPHHYNASHSQPFQTAVEAVGQSLQISLEWDFLNESQRSESVNPDMNVLVKVDGKPIDIFAMKYDGKWKDHDAVSRELKEKVEQHQALKADPNIRISSSGSKFDISALPEGVTFEIDDKGFLRVQGKRIAYGTEESSMIIPAHMLRSYTFHRVKVDQNILTLEDDYVRPEGPKPFCLNLDHTVTVDDESCFHFVRSYNP